MIRQTEKKLVSKIQRKGCYFMCLLEIWSDIAEQKLTPETINNVYLQAVQGGYITPNCYIKQGAAKKISFILNQMFDKHITIKYVGRFEKGSYKWDGSIREFTHLVGRHHKEGESLNHFKRVSKTGDCLYDPWPGLGYKKEELQDSRLFKIYMD